MRTELWLVRHGQTDWNLEGRYQGQSDVPLNQTGRRQACLLCERLAGTSFDAIYSSDLQRAAETARAAAQCLGLQVTLDPRLREINQGEWEGRLIADIRRRYADEFAFRKVDPLTARAPGGESVMEVAARLAAAADDIAAAHPGQRVLVVSHGLALATLFCQSCGLDLSTAYDNIADNATPVIITWDVLARVE